VTDLLRKSNRRERHRPCVRFRRRLMSSEIDPERRSTMELPSVTKQVELNVEQRAQRRLT